MSWEQALTPTLEQTLNMILSALANFFGTTTENIMANAPMWLAKYGWYSMLRNDLPLWMLSGAFVGLGLLGGFLLIWSSAGNGREIKPLQIIISIFFFYRDTIDIKFITFLKHYKSYYFII